LLAQPFDLACYIHLDGKGTGLCLLGHGCCDDPQRWVVERSEGFIERRSNEMLSLCVVVVVIDN